MAISNKSQRVLVQQDTAIPLTISVDNSQSIDLSLLWKSVPLSVAAVVKRLWWHIHSYGTIAGIMLLALGSLFFLCIHWSYCKVLPNFTHRVFDINEWGISRSE